MNIHRIASKFINQKALQTDLRYLHYGKDGHAYASDKVTAIKLKDVNQLGESFNLSLSSLELKKGSYPSIANQFREPTEATVFTIYASDVSTLEKATRGTKSDSGFLRISKDGEVTYRSAAVPRLIIPAAGVSKPAGAVMLDTKLFNQALWVAKELKQTIKVYVPSNLRPVLFDCESAQVLVCQKRLEG